MGRNKISENVNNPIKAIVLANSIGIISLILYYWQFVVVADKGRNIILAGFSQMFTLPLSYISSYIMIRFGLIPNGINQSTILAIQVVGLILMIIVFFSGYFYKKNLSKQHIS